MFDVHAPTPYFRDRESWLYAAHDGRRFTPPVPVGIGISWRSPVAITFVAVARKRHIFVPTPIGPERPL
jgi:hypothetical protein